ncbi:hypothetical protein MW887_008358 [Aspergillus wentii]|nr:hypothetical protein MW887_008358 [Aspergillus wentii]
MDIEGFHPPNSISDQEKSAQQGQHEVDKGGYILDTSIADENLQTTSDGSKVLIPQPSSSPYDPLNWSWHKKHLILFIISITSFLPDYGSATGAITLIPQAEEWNMTKDHVNHSQVGSVFMIGAGGVVAVALSAYFGRYPMLFWFMLIGLGTAIWCAAAQSFESFMASRILNAFFSTVAQGGGLMFIKDMFFFHEHARKINIWSSFIILSPYLGPLIAAFITNTQIWRWAFGVYTIETGLCLIAIILFVDETYYDRRTGQPELAPNGPRWKRMLGIQQWQTGYLQTTLLDAIRRPAIILCKPPVLLVMLYYIPTFAWVIGINTTLSIFVGPLYGFGPKQIGFFYFTPIVAVILAETTGHWLHDFVATVAARRNGGCLEPEHRLFAIWVVAPFMIAGLILLGFALENGYHYMLVSLGWGCFVFGILNVTVAISAYLLHSYPEASGEVAAWVSFGRTVGGFICFGKRLRIWAGPANFEAKSP